MKTILYKYYERKLKTIENVLTGVNCYLHNAKRYRLDVVDNHVDDDNVIMIHDLTKTKTNDYKVIHLKSKVDALENKRII